MRYNRGDIGSTIRAARRLAIESASAYFVYATALGYGIFRFPPTFQQAYYIVAPDGQVGLARPQEMKGE